MRCRKARFLISEYTDGTLDPRKSARLESHLESCADCREVLADLRAPRPGSPGARDAGSPG